MLKSNWIVSYWFTTTVQVKNTMKMILLHVVCNILFLLFYWLVLSSCISTRVLNRWIKKVKCLYQPLKNQLTPQHFSLLIVVWSEWKIYFINPLSLVHTVKIKPWRRCQIIIVSTYGSVFIVINNSSLRKVIVVFTVHTVVWNVLRFKKVSVIN